MTFQRLLIAGAAGLGAAVMLTLALTIFRLYLSGHGLAEPHWRLAWAVFDMDWADLVMMGGSIAVAIGVFVGWGRSSS